MKPTRPTPPAGPSGDGHGALDRQAHDRHHAQHGHGDHDGLYNEDVAHEYSDVNVRSLLIFCLGLVAVVAVTAVAMYGMFWVFERQAVQNDPVLSPLAAPAGQLPPEPRLLTDEPANLQTVRTEERDALEGYGWIDQQAGAARIPIDEAKKRLLQQGLPVRGGTPVDPWMGTYAPARGESSGGRMIPIRPGEMGPQQPAQPAAGQPVHAKPAEKKSGGH